MATGTRQILTWATLVGALYAPSEASAMDLAASGSWSVPVSASDLLTGAGSGLVSSKDSASSEVVLEVTLTSGSTDRWRIDVRRANSVWNGDVHVWVRRTGGGSGTGSVASGLTWTEVGSTDTQFFDGEGDRAGLPIQIRVTGISLSITPDAYLTSVQYTLIDTL